MPMNNNSPNQNASNAFELTAQHSGGVGEAPTKITNEDLRGKIIIICLYCST